MDYDKLEKLVDDFERIICNPNITTSDELESEMTRITTAMKDTINEIKDPRDLLVTIKDKELYVRSKMDSIRPTSPDYCTTPEQHKVKLEELLATLVDENDEIIKDVQKDLDIANQVCDARAKKKKCTTKTALEHMVDDLAKLEQEEKVSREVANRVLHGFVCNFNE